MSQKTVFPDGIKKEIFENLLNGKGIRYTAEAANCSEWVLRTHLLNGDLKDYTKFLDANIHRAGECYYDPRRKYNPHPNGKSFDYKEPAPPMQNIRYLEFKQSIRVGLKMRDYVNRISGVVVEIYPHIFTVLTEWGYKTSYKYTDYAMFNKNALPID